MWMVVKTTYVEQYPSINLEGEYNVYRNSYTSIEKEFKTKQEALDYKDTLEITSITRQIPNKHFKGVYLVRTETYTYEVYNAKTYREVVKNPKDFFLKELKKFAKDYKSDPKQFNTIVFDNFADNSPLVNVEAKKVFEPKTNKIVNYSQFNETYKWQLDTYTELLKKEKVGK